MNKKSCVILLLGMAIGLVAYGRQVMGEDWPQWRGPTRDGVWKETGIVKKFSGPQIPAVLMPLRGNCYGRSTRR